MHEENCAKTLKECLCTTCRNDHEDDTGSCCSKHDRSCPNTAPCPDYTPEHTLGDDVLSMVNAHAAKPLKGQEIPQAQALLDEAIDLPEQQCAPTALHMKLLDIGLGAFASCTAACAAVFFFRNIFTETPLRAYGFLDHLGTFLITIMGALIIAAALWRHTIPCTAYWPEWTVGKVQALREQLEEEQEKRNNEERRE